MADTSRFCSVSGRKPPERYLGKVMNYYEGPGEYAAYLGIRYAKVPEGLERYQAPKPLTSPRPPRPTASTSTYDATVPGTKCPQAPDFSEGYEDCLNLNVFVPQDAKLSKKLLPVLVFIHGGGFTYGSNDPDRYTPDSMVKHGLVFVTINYRLGLYGFLNTHTRHSPGNAGLKDQVKALEWIRDNIACFHGDPKNVTLSGCSAGATCVNLHLMSPLSKDLFHKAIVQSGGVYCPWGYRGHQNERRKALLRDPLIREALFSQKDSKKRQQLTSDAALIDRNKRHSHSLSPLFGPSVETYREGAFITEDIKNMMKKVDHNKPILAGITRGEGINQFMFDAGELKKNLRNFIYMDDQFHQILQDNFRWSIETAKNVANEIRKQYFAFPKKLTDGDLRRRYANFVRDIYFRRFYDNFKFGPEETVHDNLYVYRFDHVSDISAVRYYSRSAGLTDFYDATHCDDLKYLYMPDYLRPIYETSKKKRKIRRVVNHMCSLWANFCKTGVPKSDLKQKVQWRRHTTEQPCYMKISNKLALKEDSLFRKEWTWLNGLVDNQPTVVSELPTPASSQLPTPASSQLPTPASSQLPTPADSQLPTPADSQFPTPADSELPTPVNSEPSTPE